MDERIYWLRVDEKSTRIKKMYGFQEYPDSCGRDLKRLGGVSC